VFRCTLTITIPFYLNTVPVPECAHAEELSNPSGDPLVYRLGVLVGRSSRGVAVGVVVVLLFMFPDSSLAMY
jgi:hypothetical protein